jgi:hypothetical protein
VEKSEEEVRRKERGGRERKRNRRRKKKGREEKGRITILEREYHGVLRQSNKRPRNNSRWRKIKVG